MVHQHVKNYKFYTEDVKAENEDEVDDTQNDEEEVKNNNETEKEKEEEVFKPAIIRSVTNKLQDFFFNLG